MTVLTRHDVESCWASDSRRGGCEKTGGAGKRGEQSGAKGSRLCSSRDSQFPTKYSLDEHISGKLCH